MNRVKQLLAGLLAGLLLLSNGVTPALAAGGNVEYRGGAEGFVIAPSNNLFGSMQGLMPGGSAVEEIAVGNRSRQRCALYLSSQGQPEDAELLRLLELRIVLRSTAGAEQLVYSGSADGGTQGQVHLGNYAAGQGATLVATLTLPESLDNRWQNASGQLLWVFTAVELGGGGGGGVVVDRPTTVTPVGQATAVLPATGKKVL